jgi:hypothetical protein
MRMRLKITTAQHTYITGETGYNRIQMTLKLRGVFNKVCKTALNRRLHFTIFFLLGVYRRGQTSLLKAAVINGIVYK